MTKVAQFLDQLHWVRTIEEMKPVEDAFVRHMEAGLKGGASSLAMIPTYLTAGNLPEEAQKVIVLDAGGTNLRTFLLVIQAGKKPEVLYSSKRPIPGKEHSVSKEQFFDEIAVELLPIVNQAECIGFCFSFPCEILLNYDARIIRIDKEVSVENCHGALVGVELRNALARLGYICKHHIVVLNDTVAALLGTLAEHPADCFSGYIGTILGTGTNCCYQESNQRIWKNEYLKGQEGYSVINMESGDFNEVPLTKVDHILGKNTLDPAHYLNEKMISGAYQGQLFQYLLRCACEEGLFAPETVRRIETAETIETKHISAFMEMPAREGMIHDLASTGKDLTTIYELCDAILERAALLVVITLTAIMRYTGTGRDPLYPVAIAIEGSTFSCSMAFRQKICAYLVNYIEKQRGYYCRIFESEDANMIGSGVAVLMAKN